MTDFQVAYIPIGVPTFHLESAQKEFEKSVKVISSFTTSGVYPDKMLLSPEDLCEYADRISPHLIILQNVTFANSAYASEILKRFDCPILLWTLREPTIDGGRLRLNSLTGAYSAANAMTGLQHSHFEYIFGAPEEEEVKRQLSVCIRAAEVLYSMKSLKMAAVGHTPQGFGFGRALDLELLQVFGVTLESIEARELIDAAKSYEEEECLPYLEEASRQMCGLEKTPAENRMGFARLYKAYKEYVSAQGIGALASRCWPDFFTSYGTPVCSVLSLLNDEHIAASCEADIYGALSMYIGMKLSGQAVFFGDPVSLDEQENTLTYWHCGMAACSLASENTGACVGVHPNRKIGPCQDFGCKGCGAVTVFRIGRKPDGSFRFFVLNGSALPKPKQFTGTSVVVKADSPVKEVVTRSVKAGFEPHFAVIYRDVKAELTALGNMLGIEICDY